MSILSTFSQLLNHIFQEPFGAVYIFRTRTNRNMLLNVKAGIPKRQLHNNKKQNLHFFFSKVL